jgi:predicted CXXCH cytochrome family protein
MQVLLRKVTHDDDGQAEYLDTSLEGDSITIGSSPRCDLQLLGMAVKGLHARLQKSGSKIQLLAEKSSRFIYQGKTVRSAVLKTGDEFRIDNQIFMCVAAPSGFDLGLEWHFTAVPGHLLENAYRTSIDAMGFSPRKASWLLMLLVLVFAGLAPVADNYWRNFTSKDQNQSTDFSAIIDSEQEVPYPHSFAALGRPTADSFWLSGPMLPAHEIALGDRCEACHEKPFVQVQDNACNTCHVNVKDHLNALHPATDSFTQFRCQDCHKEHNEQQSIVSASDRLCTQCHAGIHPGVKEFTSTDHPEFSATLLSPTVVTGQGPMAVTWQAIKAPADATPKETNHLIYPHDIHLDARAVTHQQRGDALLCADCHVLNQDGEHFAPVTMEQHCADCHDLSFDINNPQKQLPHGEPPAVFDVLRTYFVDMAFSPVEKSFQRRRLPGKVTVDDRCIKDYNCAIQQTQREAEKQFLQSGCVTCHEVSTVAGAEAGDQWQVLPVKLSEDWYPAARFDHRSHLTPSDYNSRHQKALTSGVENNDVCLSCHQAQQSNSSSDVLMPGRGQCTSCHGDSADGSFFFKPRVALNCIACHGYHRGNQILARGWNDVGQ